MNDSRSRGDSGSGYVSPHRSKPSNPVGPGRPKDPAKGAAILEAARTLFLQHGFEGVSMDQIAAVAAVSKLTVYSHFGDKEKLFSAAVASYCEQQVPHALFERAADANLRDRLLQIARAFHAMASSAEAIAALRMLSTPQLAGAPVVSTFWNAGPGRINQELTLLLQRRAEGGELRLDPRDEAGLCRAASQLLALLKGDAHARLLLGLDGLAEDDVAAHLGSAVDMFLRAYGAADPRTPQP
ncbi:TetR/AcrR family transcriptional regulator [Lysobacter sp. A03]|uniref:TetR/AcrR family transcriptional regulator n=1 Tax=Lysobacter sp. A03 TaxID=1199154 RepID=UPI0005B7189E|nr:TetR/AcrR family transcriptional regulator [Lysobacter sp. A03]KIQ96337.1 Transcriptional regulator, TetR family [Lysobacter sp. A03]